MDLDRELQILVRSHPVVISYRDVCFMGKLQYIMGSSKGSIVRNNTPDKILNHSYAQQDADGYETHVSSSASNIETDKCWRSLDSLHNIYEEIRSSKLFDNSLV